MCSALCNVFDLFTDFLKGSVGLIFCFHITHRRTFLECQMCAGNDCKFRRYTDLTTTYCSIFCNNVSDTS